MTHYPQTISQNKPRNTPSFTKFEKALNELLKLSHHNHLTLQIFLDQCAGKMRTFLLMVIGLSFGEIPGISIASGFLISYVGFRMVFFSQKIWLPQFLLNFKLPNGIFRWGIRQLMRILRIMKQRTKPRFEAVVSYPNVEKVNGILIILTGLSFMCAPLIPYCSYLAYLAIFFISIGNLNEDGLFIVFGYFFSLFYFSFVVVFNSYFSIIDLFKSLWNFLYSLA